MTERVDVANLALSWLGEGDITSLEDDHNNARIMQLNYLYARDATLEAHEWSFAIKRFIPAQNAEAPEFGVTYAYDIPPDILRVLSCDRVDSTPSDFSARIGSKEQIDWVMEGSQILTDESAIYCRGVQRVEQEGKFSPLFVHALAAKLAFLTALPITASKDIQNSMLAIYAAMIHEAKTRDGLQGRSRRVRNRTMAKAR
jgi:antitoxin component HigA of HigAB toxin-antitoxin module